jgi:hypothetical protein
MENISIKITQEEADELCAALREATKKMRQAKLQLPPTVEDQG